MAPSPFPEGVASLQLDVHTGHDLAEVFVIDHAWRLVERSIGELTAELRPGVYKVKARVGEVTAEELVVMTEPRHVDLSDALALTSAAPVAHTAQTHEYHEAAAQQAGYAPIPRGYGATVLLMTRRFTEPGYEATLDPVPPTPLSLHALDSTLLARLPEDGSGPTDVVDAAAAVTVEVDPGSYALRWAGAGDILVEQRVHAAPGWQTQVFLLEEARHRGRHRISVQMSRDPFNPYRGELPLIVEAVRAALADERRIATADINDALLAKRDNPMLGLMGAHLMLIADRAAEEAYEAQRRGSELARPRAPVKFNQGLFNEVVGRLEALVGRDHPDVIALATRATDRTPADWPTATAAPMLWRSWMLLIEASNRAPELLPASTWWPTVRQLALRPFLVWSPDPDPDETRRTWATMVTDALAAGDDDVRAQLSRELRAPRAVIDELAR